MKIQFVPDSEGPFWPAIAGSAGAAFGEVNVGPRGLLGLLETALGLAGPDVSDILRAAKLIPALRATEGFWSPSFEVDEFGVARTLLGWRDELVFAGWDGLAGGDRLEALGRVSSEIPRGLPDRLRAVISALADRAASYIESITLVEPREKLPRLWREALSALEAGGTDLTEATAVPGPAQGDLLGAREPGFVPTGDGSLQLIRPIGPMAAAEEVAAWLAARSEREPTVVLGGDVILDAALERHGLPTLGAAESSDNVLLQVLPLVLQMLHTPPNPQRALELVTLRTGPVPRGLGRRLSKALHDSPAVASPKWDEALEEGLARIEDETRRDRLRARLEVLFEARTDGDSIPVEAIRNRLDLVRSWLGGNRGRVEIEAGDVSVWDAAMVQCCSLRELLDACGDVTVSQYQLQRLLREATRSAPVTARHEQKAGLTFLSSPSDLLEPCPTVVWWRFGQNSAPRPSRLALRRSEVSALGEAGVAVADPGQQAQRQAIRWGHPLVRCTQRLLLVCPRTDESGEAQEPHPLWDEIRARVAKGASIQPLEVERPSALEPPEGVTDDLLALPAPQRSWEVPSDRVFARESGESPSSLETLLGCSLHWVLKYCGGIRAGSTDMLSSGKQLLGSLAHKLIARVLEEKHWTDSSAAGARFEHTFDHDGPKIAASLFGPEHNSERARTRILGRLATVALVRHLNKAGLQATRIEKRREGEVFCGTFAGWPDLVAGPRTTVIDLKWSGVDYRCKLMNSGGALQLAAYAELERPHGDGDTPDVGYFILESCTLLTSASDVFEGAEEYPDMDVTRTWQGAKAAYEASWPEMQAGRLHAPGNPGAAGEEAVEESELDEDGVLIVAPPCRFCKFDALCGLRWHT